MNRNHFTKASVTKRWIYRFEEKFVKDTVGKEKTLTGWHLEKLSRFRHFSFGWVKFSFESAVFLIDTDKKLLVGNSIILSKFVKLSASFFLNIWFHNQTYCMYDCFSRREHTPSFVTPFKFAFQSIRLLQFNWIQSCRPFHWKFIYSEYSII